MVAPTAASMTIISRARDRSFRERDQLMCGITGIFDTRRRGRSIARSCTA